MSDFMLGTLFVFSNGKKTATVSDRIATYLATHREQLVGAWFHNQFNAEMFARFPNAYAEEAEQAQVERGHLGPLVDLLTEFARTGDTVFRDLYLAERRRFAPHREGTAVLTEYFRTVLPHDEKATANGPGGDGVQEWLRDIHKGLVESPPGKPIRVLTVGDCLLGQIQAFLRARGLEAGLQFDFRYFYFSALLGANILEEGIANTIKQGEVDLIAASYLSYEGIPLYRSLLDAADRNDEGQVAELTRGILAFMRGHLQQIRGLTDAPILLHNACGVPLGRWRRRVPLLPPMGPGRRNALARLNGGIAGIANQIDNCFLIDESSLAARHGIRHCAGNVLPRWIAKDADLHPAHLARYLADEYLKVAIDWSTLRKTKLLLVDFDNTLWDGVMADGPVRHHHERQELLKRLSEQGILLAAVSKNDPRNIRWDEMKLAASDFVSLKIGWNLKVQSIREIAQELNLGRDSFVLLDDNPAELELVRQELPDVVCLDSTTPATWLALERLFQMPNTRQTEEARHRTQMYREQTQREESIRQTTDYPALMATLSLRASVGRARSADLDRLVELIQRTNQFNTTTTRYSRGQIEAMMKSPEHEVVVGELADKFGNLGIVCAAVVRRSTDEAVIDNFVMSCRAMGFGMEQLMLQHLVAANQERTIVGRFVPSARNEPASTLYPSSGFAEHSSGEWHLPRGSSLSAPPWISVENRG